VALAAAFAAGCGNKGGGSAGGSGDGLVTVNGANVSVEELHKYLERKQSVQVIGEQGLVEARVAGSLALQGMRDLINRQLLMQIAKEEGVAPTPEAVAKELEYQTKRNPALVKTLTQAGLTLDEIRADLALDLARFNLLTKGVTITQSDVDLFIKENPKEFVNPETVDLYWVLLRNPANKAKVDKDLASGQQFPVVAARYSEAQDARRQNGVYPIREVSRLNPRLKTIVDKLKPGSSTEWIQDGQNAVKFFLQGRTPEAKVNIDEAMREQVRRRLAEARGGQANDLGKTLTDRLKAAKIEVKVPHLREAWTQAFDAVKNQDAGATATGTATPPAAGTATK